MNPTGRSRKTRTAPLPGLHHDTPLRFLPLALARHAVHGRHRVMDDLALERAHRLQLDPLPGFAHRLGGGAAELPKLLPASGPPTGDVEHQPAPDSGLLLDR